MYENIIERSFVLKRRHNDKRWFISGKKWYNAYIKMNNGQCTNRY